MTKHYTVTLAPHELEALHRLMLAARAMATVIGGAGNDEGYKLMGLSQTIEGIIERVEDASLEPLRDTFLRGMKENMPK